VTARDLGPRFAGWRVSRHFDAARERGQNVEMGMPTLGGGPVDFEFAAVSIGVPPAPAAPFGAASLFDPVPAGVEELVEAGA
jgi:hypothetical protein